MARDGPLASWQVLMAGDEAEVRTRPRCEVGPGQLVCSPHSLQITMLAVENTGNCENIKRSHTSLLFSFWSGAFPTVCARLHNHIANLFKILSRIWGPT